MKLRNYQKTIVKKIKKKRKKHKHILISAPTGAGKTIIFSHLASKWSKKKKRTLILVPRTSLLKQIYNTLESIGFDMTEVNVIHGKRKRNPHAKVHIGMINTLYNRLNKYGKKYLGHIDNIIIDEVHIGHHKGMYKTVEKLYWKKSHWYGFSATPMDNKGYMLEGYDTLIHDVQTIDLVDEGWLLPLKIYKEKAPDLNDISMVGNEYNQKELGDLMNRGSLVTNAYDIWSKGFSDKKTMIFCVNIDHAELIAEKFKENGVAVVVSHSKNSDTANDYAHKQFAEGHAQVLVSINKLTAGFDEPSVEVLLALRPTLTKSLFLQSVGRTLRLHSPLDTTLSMLEGDLEYN